MLVLIATNHPAVFGVERASDVAVAVVAGGVVEDFAIDVDGPTVLHNLVAEMADVLHNTSFVQV